MTAEEILAEFEKALELERELGVKRVEFDRSLLEFPPPAAAAAAPTPAMAPVKAPAAAPKPVAGAMPAAAEPAVPQVAGSDLVLVAAAPAELQGVAGALLLNMLKAIGRDLGTAPVEVAGADLAVRLKARQAKIVLLLGREACRAVLPGERMEAGAWVRYGTALAAAIPSPAFMMRFYADKPEELNRLKRIAWAVLKEVQKRLGPPGKR